jgi:hypothetical protein
MAQLEPLPDLEIKFDELNFQMQKLEEKIQLEPLPDQDPIHQPTNQPHVEQNQLQGLPKTLIIKKQCKAVLWHTPEQDFQFTRHEIDFNNMEELDNFLTKNIPKDPSVGIAALKFIEDVLRGKTEETESRVFYNDGKNKSFKIFFELHV